MSYAIVKWNKQNIHFIGDIRLLPGANQVTKDQLAEIENHWICQHQIKAGVMEVVIKDFDDQGLGGLKPAEAVRLANETFDHELLAKWLGTEKRPHVIKALKSQLEKVLVVPSTEPKAVEVPETTEEHFS